MDPMTKSFVADIHHVTEAHGLDLVHFGKERKDDLTQRYLAGFSAREGVLYVGRGQEKAVVWSTQKRRRPDGTGYAWLVKTSAMVNHFYVYCVDADFGPFFLKFCSYFRFNAKLYPDPGRIREVGADLDERRAEVGTPQVEVTAGHPPVGLGERCTAALRRRCPAHTRWNSCAPRPRYLRAASGGRCRPRTGPSGCS
jgi:hypothetical protein